LQFKPIFRMNQLAKYKVKLEDLCEKHYVNKLYAFGSVVSDRFDLTKSDIDLIVELNIENPVEKGEHLMQLWSELELLFSRKVDLLTTQKIKNPYLSAEIERTKRIVYESKIT